MKLIPYEQLQKMIQASPLLTAIMKKRQAEVDTFFLLWPRR